MRTFLLLVTVIGSAGCYDLSAPNGPSPDDFARNSGAAPAEPDDDSCAGDDCPAESALTTRATKPATADRSNDVVIANDAAQQALQAAAK